MTHFPRFTALAAAVVVLCAAPAARADILYSYNTTLDVRSGPDTALLDGATANISFEVPNGSVYVDRFGRPAVPVVDPLITIVGSGVAANNGTFALVSTAFYPVFAGFFTEPGGNQIDFSLPSGGTLTVRGNTVATASGSAAVVGGMPVAADFGPTTSAPGLTWFLNDGTNYDLVGTVVTATGSIAAVPEPGTLALLLAGTVGAGAGTLRRRKA